MILKERAYILNFDKIGDSKIGYLSVYENNDVLPFEVKRLFWTYFTPEEVIRGRHAHYQTQQILISVFGEIHVDIEYPSGEKEYFKLNKPDFGLYIPPNCWHQMKYSHSSVQLCIASELYDESDYIRDYNLFKAVYNK